MSSSSPSADVALDIARILPGEHARRGTGRRAVLAVRVAWRTAVPVAISVAATLLYAPGYVGYDSGWALLWGKQLAAGHAPSLTAPGAPTPHPLANVVALALSPLGDAAAIAFTWMLALCFGLLTLAAYRLGTRLFGAPVGVLFAAIVFTRPALINLQAQPVDIPFLAFILMAAALEAQRPRRGGAVLWLLVLAGLLRPEGWLLLGAYALYALPARRSLAAKLGVLAAAASAPLTWAAFDWLATGDPAHSLHGTQQLAVALERPRGVGAVLTTAPAAIADILGMPLALAGLAGCLVGVLALYHRALLPAALIALGMCGFVVVGLMGLPVLDRYLLVPIVALALFAAVALAGWGTLDRRSRWRVPWMVGAFVVACAVAVHAGATIEQTRGVVGAMQFKSAIERDLHDVTRAPVWRRRDGRPVHVATRRAVPRLAAWLDLPLETIFADEPPHGTRALVLRPANDAVAIAFYSLSTPTWSPAPSPAWRELYRNRSWVLYASPARSDVRGGPHPRRSEQGANDIHRTASVAGAARNGGVRAGRRRGERIQLR